VTWSNIWYSGVLTTSCYAAARLAVRWAAVPVRSPVAVGAPGAGAGAERAPTAEDKWRAFAFGGAAIITAFYLSWLVQLVWYALTQPWVETPRPF
jgi:hypothetical protein